MVHFTPPSSKVYLRVQNYYYCLLLLLSLDTKVWNVLFHFTNFYMYIVFMCCIVLNVLGLCLFYLCISFSLSGYRSY